MLSENFSQTLAFSCDSLKYISTVPVLALLMDAIASWRSWRVFYCFSQLSQNSSAERSYILLAHFGDPKPNFLNVSQVFKFHRNVLNSPCSVFHITIVQVYDLFVQNCDFSGSEAWRPGYGWKKLVHIECHPATIKVFIDVPNGQTRRERRDGMMIKWSGSTLQTS